MKHVLGGASPVLAAVLISLAMEGCIFSASQKQWTPEPWPPGEYELFASGASQSVTAHLTIGPDGEMAFSSSGGTCRERTDREIEHDRTENQRTFPCNGGSFRIRPRGNTIQGEVGLSETRSVRGNRFCATRDDKGNCLHYEYESKEETVTRSVRLQVVRRGGEGVNRSGARSGAAGSPQGPSRGAPSQIAP